MAIQIIREVSADVVKRGATRAVYAKQNDVNSRFLNVRIQEDGTNITIDQTAKVVLNVERPDKQESMFYGSVNEDGTVKIPMTSWMLELEGTLLCDISIVAEGDTVAKLTTMQFSIYVEAAVCCDASFDDTEEYSVIVDLLKRTDEAAVKAETAAENAQAAADSANELKEKCEAATQGAEDAATDVEKALEELAAGGFIKSMEEQNKEGKISFWIGTQAEYDALEEKTPDRFYIISDDPTGDALRVLIEKDHRFLKSIWSEGDGGSIPYGDVTEYHISVDDIANYELVEVLTSQGKVICSTPGFGAIKDMEDGDTFFLTGIGAPVNNTSYEKNEEGKMSCFSKTIHINLSIKKVGSSIFTLMRNSSFIRTDHWSDAGLYTGEAECSTSIMTLSIKAIRGLM